MLTKAKLKEIIEIQNKEIKKRTNFVERDKLKDTHISKSFARIISGIRRCGKSTLLIQLMKKEKKVYYLNLSDPRLQGFEFKHFMLADEIFKELFGEKGVYFFDEIQEISEWEKYIRFLVDNKSKVVLTGSNASMLSKELGTKLTGRHLTTELFPFSYKEFLIFTKLKPEIKSYKKYFQKGGFPEYLENDLDEILHELLKDVVIRDVAIRHNIKNLNNLNKLVNYLITNVGKEFSYNSLKKIIHIASVQTVIDFISYLEDSYLVFTLPKFDYSFKKQQVAPKKIYSIDNGLSNANSISFSKDVGKMLENQVFLELKRKGGELFYFQEKGECDFLVKEKNKITKAIQVCYELNDENINREVDGILEAVKKFKLKEALIITFNQEDKIIKDNLKIKVIPIWRWLLE
ncbi:ATP-binding protein [Candidatus Pacearchaeota archaeon]|nr:ATP-binding protein [Candidatus Pacearchaeota archaeon]